MAPADTLSSEVMVGARSMSAERKKQSLLPDRRSAFSSATPSVWLLLGATA